METWKERGEMGDAFEHDVVGVGGEPIKEIGSLFFGQNRESGVGTHKHDLQVKREGG